MTSIQVGYILRSDSKGFVTGSPVSQKDIPDFGSLVSAPLEDTMRSYGLIYDIRVLDDGLVRQLVTAGNVTQEVIRDNRERRIVPLELSVLSVGYEKQNHISHLLPPRPPLSLDLIQLCDDKDLTRFVGSGSFGYFRHILQAQDIPIADLLAAHIRQVSSVHPDSTWVENACHELITLLRDDYPALMSVLRALGELFPQE